MISSNKILNDGTPSTIADTIDNILLYTEEDRKEITNDIRSNTYTNTNTSEIFCSLATGYKINDKTYSKEPNEVLLYLNRAIVDTEYIAAFQKARLKSFDYDYETIRVNNKDYNVEKETITEIPIATAFKYGYLKPFMLFIKNKFIFWSCITFIHNINGNYLRIIDNNGLPDELYCNWKWTKREEYPDPNYFHDGSDNTHEYIVSQGDDPYHITEDDISMVFLPISMDYSDEIIVETNPSVTARNAEIIFDRDGYMIPKLDINDMEVHAFLKPTKNDTYIITSSWGEGDQNLKDYINNGKKLYMDDIITFKSNDDDRFELYVTPQGEEGGEIDTVEELMEKEDKGFMYAIVNSNKITYPISLKDEFLIKNVIDNSFNKVLSIPLDERHSYSEIVKQIKEYNLNLLRSPNKDIFSVSFTFNKDMLKNKYLYMSRYVSDEYESYVMIFCDGILIDNYYTIQYTLDGYNLYFDDNTANKYNGKEFEIVFFNRVDNRTPIYDGAKKYDTTVDGIEVFPNSDLENLKLFVDRATTESYPWISHDERNQYELEYYLKTKNITFKDICKPEETKDIEVNYLNLYNEQYYIKKIAFISNRQFRYCSKVLNGDEYRFELSSDFKYCRTTNKFMVFYNGYLLDHSKYYFTFPDPTTPVNTSSIYLRIQSNDWTKEDGNRVDVFYIPNYLTDIKDMCQFDKSKYTYNGISIEGIGVIKYVGMEDNEGNIVKDDLVYPLSNDLCFIFKNGIKIPYNKTYNLGTNRIVLPDLHNMNTDQYMILRHSIDLNDEYIRSIESDECIYEALLNEHEYDSNGYNVYTNGFYVKTPEYGNNKDNIGNSNNDISISDKTIYNRIVIDYYMQEGTRLDRYTVPMSIPVMCTKYLGNSGDYILSPNTNITEE